MWCKLIPCIPYIVNCTVIIELFVPQPSQPVNDHNYRSLHALQRHSGGRVVLQGVLRLPWYGVSGRTGASLKAWTKKILSERP